MDLQFTGGDGSSGGDGWRSGQSRNLLRRQEWDDGPAKWPATPPTTAPPRHPAFAEPAREVAATRPAIISLIFIDLVLVGPTPHVGMWRCVSDTGADQSAPGRVEPEVGVSVTSPLKSKATPMWDAPVGGHASPDAVGALGQGRDGVVAGIQDVLASLSLCEGRPRQPLACRRLWCGSP